MDLDWIRPSKEIVDGMLRIVERIGSGRWKRRRMGSSHEQDGAMNETDNIDEEEEMARDARVWGGVIADSNKATVSIVLHLDWMIAESLLHLAISGNKDQTVPWQRSLRRVICSYVGIRVSFLPLPLLTTVYVSS